MSDLTLTRRTLLASTCAAALLLVEGCALFGGASELDERLAELDRLLEQLKGADATALARISTKLSEQLHGLLDAHREFAVAFNDAAADRSVPDEALLDLVSRYESDRRARRDALLRTQDELHDAIPAEAWPEVAQLLNRKSQFVAPRRGREG